MCMAGWSTWPGGEIDVCLCIWLPPATLVFFHRPRHRIFFFPHEETDNMLITPRQVHHRHTFSIQKTYPRPKIRADQSGGTLAAYSDRVFVCHSIEVYSLCYSLIHLSGTPNRLQCSKTNVEELHSRPTHNDRSNPQVTKKSVSSHQSIHSVLQPLVHLAEGVFHELLLNPQHKVDLQLTNDVLQTPATAALQLHLSGFLMTIFVSLTNRSLSSLSSCILGGAGIAVVDSRRVSGPSFGSGVSMPSLVERTKTAGSMVWMGRSLSGVGGYSMGAV